MPVGLLEARWPRPVPDGIERARGWHLRALTQWLTRAGAEPRLCLILCAGRGARDALLDACVTANVDVAPAPVRAARPIAPALAAHRGDHFNSTLFLMEGLSAASDDVLGTLDGLRGQLRRMATWVGLVVDDLATLDRLQQHAPGLMLSVQRSALVLGASPGQASASLTSLAAWRKRGRVAELAFAAATSTAAPSQDDLARLLRTGYGDVLATLDLARARLHAAWQASTARDALGEFPAADTGVERWAQALDRAERRAEAGDLAGCMGALAEAEPPLEGAAPELAVTVLEKRVTLFTFTGDRAAARAALDRLDDHVARLASPGYAARAVAARARFVESLDPARARLDLLEAERVFRAHGYPEAAAELMEALT